MGTYVNDLPVAVGDTANISMNIAVDINVTSNDYDFDGYVDYDSVEIASSPGNGITSVDPISGIVTYTPESGFTGDDSFTYTVMDDDGATSNVATVHIEVIASLNR